MSIEELIDRYGDDILRLCTAYLGDRQLAEDAFQETFTKAWKGLSSFRGESGERTWLAHIAVNTCRDLLRSGWFRMRKKSQPIEALEAAASQPEAQDAFVRDAVLALPGMYREVIVLYYHQNMSMQEIAEMLRLSPNTVSTRLRRAREKLRRTLGEEPEA